MKGDFSRLTFDADNHFSQVLLQQGRVTLDADPNEQGAILLHYLRTMARDLFGPYAGPVGNRGFALTVDLNATTPALIIGAGRYYVDGILCESDGCNYIDQPHYIPTAAVGNAAGDPLRTWLENRGEGNQKFWVYLDVWERHVTAIEHPSIREVALGGPDTCSRVQVIWQVRSMEARDVEFGLKRRLTAIEARLNKTTDPVEAARLKQLHNRILEGMRLLAINATEACAVPLLALERDDLPAMAARIDPGQRLDDPCIISPESGYRGAENHLYRVEIHQGDANGARPTFKWSRDNGSVATRWLAVAGDRLTVANTRGFTAGQWVELTNDEDDLLGRAGPLFRIASVDADQLTVEGTPAWVASARNPKVRRWDQVAYGDVQLLAGAVRVIESDPANPVWIDLEDGVQVRFAKDREYRTGDYWLIPARVATGRLEWPEDASGLARLQPPRGIEHHYAPLGFVGREDNQAGIVIKSCDCTVYPLSSCGVIGERMKEIGVRPETPVKPPVLPPDKVSPAPVAPTPAEPVVVAKPADTGTVIGSKKSPVAKRGGKPEA